MLIKEKLTALEQTKIFRDWHKENKDSFLAHIFRMPDEANEKIWQFGYYNKDDTITTLILNDDKVDEVPEQEIFKQDKHKLEPLDLAKVKLSFEDAVKAAEALQQKKYSQHPILKKIMILQIIENIQLYNITFVTQTFHTLNIRLDAKTGKIILEKLTSLMDIAKFEKGKGEKEAPDYIG